MRLFFLIWVKGGGLHTGMLSLNHVMTGEGVPVTSQIKLMGWFITTEMFDGRLLSRTSGGTGKDEKK